MKKIAILHYFLGIIPFCIFLSLKGNSQTTFNASGTYTFATPAGAGITSVTAQAWDVGGSSTNGGSSSFNTNSVISVGGNGAYARTDSGGVGNGSITYAWLLGSNSNHSSVASCNYIYSQKNGHDSAYQSISKQTLDSKNIKIATWISG